MPHDVTPDDEGIVITDLFALLPEELASATLTETELTGKFVGEGAIAWQNGRGFAMFKPPGDVRNKLYELFLAPVRLQAIGYTPGVWYKCGECDLCFGPLGELWALDTCSPEPGVGAAVRPVLWQTGIVVGIASGGAGITQAQLDAALAPIRFELAQMRAQKLDARLDAMAPFLIAAGNAAKG